MKITNTPKDPLARWLGMVCALIIVLLPFHAFLTVWGSSLLGHYTELRLWKEILLLILLVGALAVLVRQRAGWTSVRRLYGRSRLVGVISTYAGLVILCGAVAYFAGGVSPKALFYGILLDLRFLLFFGIVWLASVYGGPWLYDRWRQIFLIPAGIVVVFGLLQFAVLPSDFLMHFGYGSSTIDAVQTVDEKDAYQRIQSTLRGANPFGAYLVLVIAALGAMLLKRTRLQSWYAVGLAVASAALALTFSRSAWIGAVLAIAWLLYVNVGAGKLRQTLMVAAACGMFVLAGAGYVLRDNDHFQNAVFHTDEHSLSSESSNTGHFSATYGGIKDVVSRPWGRGTGTAGPASVYNSRQSPRIAENYFVQVGQEAGLFGALLFVAICVLLGRELWLRRNSALALALLASLIGISAINLLSHAWTDDTLSYVWWGLAGAVMALPLARKSANQKESV